MIGIFDSGVGGLSVLRAVRDVFPSVDVVYFGDTKNAPYGNKPRSELSTLTIANIEFLLKHGATTIISACNSVSASLAISIHDVLPLGPSNLIEMVGPTVSYFKESDARIALCATSATIESELYQSAFRMIGKDITPIAIPELAGAIEAGAGEKQCESYIREALEKVPRDSFDVLVLACTHYPLVLGLFRRVVGDSVLVFDPAQAVAERVLRDLWPREVGYGSTKFYLSKDSAVFRGFVKHLFGETKYEVEVIV